MYESFFSDLGLSPNEAKVYEALLSKKSSSLEDIALKSNVHRRNVYDVLGKLKEKGLVSEKFINNRKEYSAINPTRLMDMLDEKKSKLEKALPELQKKFDRYEEKETAYVYKGIQGFKNYMNDILECGEDGYFIGAKGGWFDPRLKHFLPKFMEESKKKGLTYHHLFDYEMKEKMPEIFNSPSFKYKLLPKEYSTNSAIDIFGDHVVTFTGLNIGKLDEELTQFVIISRSLADAYRTWFKLLWDKL